MNVGSEGLLNTLNIAYKSNEEDPRIETLDLFAMFKVLNCQLLSLAGLVMRSGHIVRVPGMCIHRLQSAIIWPCHG